MRLKVNDTEDFNLTLDLNVDYEGGCLPVVVRLWDKKAHKTIAWEYHGGTFGQALEKYDELEKAYFGGK